MTLRISSTQLKAKLGRYMRAVRSGQEVVVTDREEPVARLVPYKERRGEPQGGMTAHPRDPAAPPLGQVTVRPIKYRGPSTSELLSEDRGRR